MLPYEFAKLRLKLVAAEVENGNGLRRLRMPQQPNSGPANAHATVWRAAVVWKYRFTLANSL